MSAPKLTAADLRARLRRRYPSEKGWALVFERRNGLSWSASRSIDAFATHTWQSKYPHHVAFEIKTTKADFRRELADPSKRAWIEEQVTEFWFVAPRGVIPVDELPDGCGLLEAWGKAALRIARAATQRPGREPASDFWVVVLRGAVEELNGIRHEGQLEAFAEFAGKAIGMAGLRKLAKALHGQTRDHHFQWEVKEEVRKIRAKRIGEHDAYWDPRRAIISEAERLAEAVLGDHIHVAPPDYRHKDPEKVVEALRSIRQTHEAGDLARRLREAADLIDGGR